MVNLVEQVDSFPSLQSFISYSDHLDPDKELLCPCSASPRQRNVLQELERIQWLRDGMAPEEASPAQQTHKASVPEASRSSHFLAWAQTCPDWFDP